MSDVKPSIAAIAVCAVILFPFAKSVRADQAENNAQWQMEIDSLTTAPTAVRIDMVDKTFKLNPVEPAGAQDANIKSVYRGPLVVEEKTEFFQPAKVSAMYGGPEAVEYIPLRLYRSPKSVQLAVEHLVPVTCDNPDISKIQLQSADFDTNLHNYYIARALYHGNACGSRNKKLAAKAWFDRSYALATDALRTYIGLDRDATIAVQTFDPTYTNNYLRQVQGYELKIINDQKKRAQSERDYNKALALNQTLIAKLDSDENLEKFALINQGISHEQMEKDGAFFAARANQ